MPCPLCRRVAPSVNEDPSRRRGRDRDLGRAAFAGRRDKPATLVRASRRARLKHHLPALAAVQVRSVPADRAPLRADGRGQSQRDLREGGRRRPGQDRGEVRHQCHAYVPVLQGRGEGGGDVRRRPRHAEGKGGGVGVNDDGGVVLRTLKSQTSASLGVNLCGVNSEHI